MKVIVGVRFKKSGKIYFFNPGNLHINLKNKVIVETALGEELGEVVAKKKLLTDNELNSPLKKVIRIANHKDIKHDEENKKKENKKVYKINYCILSEYIILVIISLFFSFVIHCSINESKFSLTIASSTETFALLLFFRSNFLYNSKRQSNPFF